MHNCSNIPMSAGNTSLEEVLKSHTWSVVNVGEYSDERQRITVRRRHIWSDTKRALRRPSFNPHIGLDIHFIGEDAQDEGGPLREFFRLLWIEISGDNTIFTGSSEARLLAHNMLSLSNGDYALVGRVISLALVYGGSGPHFLSEAVASYLLNEPIAISENACEVPDLDVQNCIQKVSMA